MLSSEGFVLLLRKHLACVRWGRLALTVGMLTGELCCGVWVSPVAVLLVTSSSYYDWKEMLSHNKLTNWNSVLLDGLWVIFPGTDQLLVMR